VNGLRSGQLAEAVGVNPQTLRYYERRGLLSEPERTTGGHRLYPPETVTMLRGVKAAQRLGFTLEEITALLARAGLRDRARVKLGEIEVRIEELTAVADMLRAAVDAGCDDLEVCATVPECPLPLG
jgi:DNA-binding transcriptional MerR regulator